MKERNMRYDNLVDFSVYASDLERVEGAWKGLKKYIEQSDADGLELLIGYEPASDEIPKELVKSIHLPFWITWLDVWRKGEKGLKAYFPPMPADHIQSCCGGSNQLEMIATQKMVWELAAVYNPKQAVMHAAHVELEHVFTRKFTYTDTEVLQSFSELLNRTAHEFSDGEPPCVIGIENLWWPGLNFLDSALTDDFAGFLNFDKWNFVLDTGHLMNTNPKLRCEDEAVDFVLEKLNQLSSDIRKRIQSIHLNLSLSGEYQLKQMRKGLPADWENLNHTEKYNSAKNHVLKIDQHLPFQTERVKEIVDFVQPHTIVHEFITPTMVKYDAYLKQQMGALV
ncbi:sugar phosphate isomerase [Ancylomarina sp. 16SWW S1-10-2]|uniref:sugar phosphate isomerase n=1 Tax=Ancylomarina sp. 16SWW S1-10-2 TaxID=2499681 RepID=UPI0012AE0A68|nr:sugar phosphate isomerase [Ancylomarina sp. 16SWW S1-10-2]MRT92657.1 sugar phosphate isomerase [Ancylomarina sp. 16SWW S1-10-2]